MRAIKLLLVLWVIGLTSPCGAGGPPTRSSGTLDLLANGAGNWSAQVDSGKTTIALSRNGSGADVTIAAAGEPEAYPKLSREWRTPQDWTGYLLLRMRVRVTCDDPAIVNRPLTFVFYDAKTVRPDLPDHPMTQQTIAHAIPVGQWVDVEDRLLPIHRTEVRGMAVYLYETPPASPYHCRWEFQRLDLVGAGQQADVFDGCLLPKGSIPRTSGARRCGVSTSDGLTLGLTDAGAVAGVTLGARRVGDGPPHTGGLMVRDAAAGGAPVPAIGRVSVRPGAIGFVGEAKGLGVDLRATYRSLGPRIEIAGSVIDRRGTDRALTVYFALPLRGDDWTWWDSVSGARPGRAGSEELAYLEGGMEFGLHGTHSKYPLGAISSPNIGGLTLGVRMDEPVVHRIAYNPPLRLFYIALDFGLTGGRTRSGRSLREAPFRILLYRHDPEWGFRSALERYYRMFPQFFVRRTRTEGGWFCWGDISKTADALEAGFGEHWGPAGYDAVKWDAAHGINSFLYIEPELFQLTMGDSHSVPTPEAGIDRLRRLASGDPVETANFCKLGYARSYLPAEWLRRHSLEEAVREVTRAAQRSAVYAPNSAPAARGGQYDFMGDSQMGVTIPCNLDPDIPGGKGWFASDLYLKPELANADSQGAHFSGVGLDSFGGYDQSTRADYRSENFQYTDEPLCFDSAHYRPVRVAVFATVKWLRRFAGGIHRSDRFLMANCSWQTTPGWLTFAAPYLDVFGAEAPSFADPDFIRALARTKSCTDLPYNPQPDYMLPLHLLHAIYPGLGNRIDDLKRITPLLRTVAQAGWQPITGARAAPPTVRLERFGTGSTLYLVLHNPTARPARVAVTLEPRVLGSGRWTAELPPGEERSTDTGGSLRVNMPALGTTVIRLWKDLLP